MCKVSKSNEKNRARNGGCYLKELGECLFQNRFGAIYTAAFFQSIHFDIFGNIFERYLFLFDYCFLHKSKTNWFTFTGFFGQFKITSSYIFYRQFGVS